MADLQHETAKRSGDLAAQLAAEVRAGRPERCRLRAYCGCEAARFVLGPNPECPRRENNGPPGCWQCGDPASLPTWLTGLARLAWAPPLWVPCSTCGCGADCPTLSSHPATVDPAQWVLAVAACGVARAVLTDTYYREQRTWTGTHYVLSPAWLAAQAAIEAAEQWTRCPCSECASNAANLARRSGHSHTVFGAPARACVGQTTECIENLVRGGIGPDAAREAAARAVLEVV